MYPDLGRRLKFARIAAGFTQQALAEAAGVSQSLITKIEAGRSKRPRPEILIKLSKAISLPEDLFLEKDNLKEQKVNESLERMLVSSGVSEEAAAIIVRSLRTTARRKLKETLEK